MTGAESIAAFKEIRDNAEEEARTNVGMMRRVVRAIKRLSPSFRSDGFFVYPGGTRGYGIYRPGGIFKAPLTESMADTLPADYAQTVAYPHYRAMLATESAGQSWSWCELCPDAIIGFTPNGSGYSLAGHWAVYLYAWKLVHGEGGEIPFPGTKEGYEALYTETSTGVLARVAIYAALHPEAFRERIFNVADSATPGRMLDRWPEIAAWFGLQGVPPLSAASVKDPKPSDFIKEHAERLRDAGAKGVQIWNAQQLDSYGYWLTFDRHLSLERVRDAGFTEERPPREGWEEAFDMFRKAGMVG
jgi:nucleoside-diphosphate-sugar epimerase